MQIVLPRLPYELDALEPYVSKTTLGIHYGKHHRAYVEKTKELAKDVFLADRSLEEILQITTKRENHRALFNNAAQAWNHSFYWRSLQPGGDGEPRGEIARRIDTDFGGHGPFIDRFTAAAASQFGSGWIWLVLHDDRLEIIKTSNADNPLVRNLVPLLTVDVWEHAYYLDYQNRRPAYVTAILENLINWDFANKNLARPTVSKSLFDPLIERVWISTGL